jgi:hypothetical protein
VSGLLPVVLAIRQTGAQTLEAMSPIDLGLL